MPQRSFYKSWSFRSLATSALCLYLLVHAFLILCLVHPHNTHLQGRTDAHPVSVCAWVHNTVASHVPSSAVVPPLIITVLLIVPLALQSSPETYPIKLTGRSPPLLASI